MSESNANHVTSMLQNIAFESNLFKKLHAVDVICSALDNEVAEVVKAKEFKKYINKEYLLNKDFIRKLKLISMLESYPETSIELSSQDYITHPEFHYDESFHNKIGKLNRMINHFTGICMKELNKGESIEFGTEEK